MEYCAFFQKQQISSKKLIIFDEKFQSRSKYFHRPMPNFIGQNSDFFEYIQLNSLDLLIVQVLIWHKIYRLLSKNDSKNESISEKN